MAAVKHDYEKKESLIQKAKAEYTKKTMPPEKKTAGGGGKSTRSLRHVRVQKQRMLLADD